MAIGRRIPFGPQGFGSKVLISVPNQDNLNKFVAQWLLEVSAFEQRMHGDIVMPTDRPYEQNLHQIVLDLNHRKYDFWVNIDSDNPPIANVLDLVLLDKDMIGCPTPVWNWVPGKGERPIYWNAFDYVSEEDGYREHPPAQGGLQKVDAVGTGCFVLAQRCFNSNALRQGAFARKLDVNGLVYKGNDISFCERMREAGFQIYAHYSYPCRHFNSIDLLEGISAYGELIQRYDG